MMLEDETFKFEHNSGISFCFMSLAKSTLWIYLPKKCVMVHTFDVYGTLSCLVYPTFFKPLFWQFIMDDNCFQHL